MPFDLLVKFLSSRKQARAKDFKEGELKALDWFGSHITAKKIIMLCGELSFGCNDPAEHRKMVALTSSAIKRNRLKLEVVCGPEIWVSNDTRRNELFFLLDEQDEMIKRNLRIYVTPIRPPIHFIIAGNDLLVESSHEPHELEGRRNYTVDNSSVLVSRLLKDFNKWKKQSERMLKAQGYPKLLTLDELRELATSSSQQSGKSN